jgi:phosphoribosylaminoimidazolecarboxamide formyltransferase/IMP cyclohydrolase
VHRFDEPACVIVKHANPCGVAVAADITTAYERANACDPVSAFGGIVARQPAAAAAPPRRWRRCSPRSSWRPAYDDDALATLTAKPNLRVLTARRPARPLDVRPSTAACSCRRRPGRHRPRAWWVVTKRRRRRAVGRPAVRLDVCAAVSLERHRARQDRQAFGIGAGQQNRVDSARIAADARAGRRRRRVCASDAYFPFRDGLDVAADAGVTAVIQPGGSIRDAEVIEAADECGLVMVFTGERHFRH